ncbi:MAG: SLBB domain-containing protein [Chloroflexi bacterium]|nr:SLBB domain-containing protein [Chloroflexota bacterium]
MSREDFVALQGKARERWQSLERPAIPRVVVQISACSVSVGAEQVYRELERQIQTLGASVILSKTGCGGMCYEEPIVDVIKPEGPRISYRKRISYRRVHPEEVSDFLRECVLGDRIWQQRAIGVIGTSAYQGVQPLSEHPYWRTQQRTVLGNFGVIDPEEIEDYLAVGGYSAFIKAAFEMSPEEVIAEVKKSDLEGRGGAGFPTGRKWETARATQAWPKYIICNGEEGEPSIYKDRRIVEGDPHQTIEGVLIAGYAVGASQGYIYIGVEHSLAYQRMGRAIAQAQACGMLGDDIFGSGFSFHISLRRGAGSYAAGESSAMMSSVEGQRGMPRVKLVRSAERGLWQKPTVMNNVETLSTVPAIIANGGEWYAQIGTGKSKGTKVFAPSGHIRRPGFVELPLGTSLRHLIYDICGGVSTDRPLKAIQPAGPTGGCMPPDLLDTPLDFVAFEEAGSALGTGSFVVFDDSVCIVNLVDYYIYFNELESCSRCITCRVSSMRMHDILLRIINGQGVEEDLELLKLLDRNAHETALCGLGQVAGVPAVVASQRFRDEFLAHIREKRCPAGVCQALTHEPVAAGRAS